MRQVAVLALLSLAGCATVEPLLPPTLTQDEQRQQLLSLSDWSFNGRVAVASGGEGFSAAMDWQQQGTAAVIGLRGPLGSSALKVMITGETLSLDDGRGGVLEGEEAEQLLVSRLGTALPVSQLRFWVLGLAAPGELAQQTIAANGRLTTLEQDGWQMRYDLYRASGPFVLPARMELASGDVRVRLVIRDWTLRP